MLKATRIFVHLAIAASMIAPLFGVSVVVCLWAGAGLTVVAGCL